jgi:hypothetical protein
LAKPTKADAELLLRVIAIMRSDEEYKKAGWWFYEEFDEKSYTAFKKKYPMGSEGSRNFRLVAGYWEVLATLLNNGLLSEDLVFDMFAMDYDWKKAEPIVHGIRNEHKMPRLYENFEALAKKYSEWEKKHPPKV